MRRCVRATICTPAAVLALEPKTGKIKWHYQFSPNNPFDYDAVAEMVLADMTIEGKPTKVLMDANRNGFFYVLDRTNGKLLAANPYVKVNWATGIDMKTGRPIETDISKDAREGKKVTVQPSILGGKNWEPMSLQSADRPRLRQYAQYRRQLQGRTSRLTSKANGTSAWT